MFIFVEKIKMFYPRKIYQQLKNHLSKKQITVITGMRRTGKTTLVKKLLSDCDTNNKIYIDLERLDNRQLFTEKNYENIIYALHERGLNFKKKVFLFIDEIQLSPEITSVLKYLYDHYKIKFIVTGSSSFYLKNLFSESLSGRKKIFELYPLDFAEVLTFKNIHFSAGDFTIKKFSSTEYERIKFFYDEYVEYGGFPEVVLCDNVEDKKDLIHDIISSYVNIDIKTLSDFRNEKNIYSLIKMLSGRVGTRLDYTKLSNLAGLTRQTVQNYIDFFEKTFLLKRVSVITKNPDREIVKSQKVYFCDHGISSVLGNISSGSKFENAVFNQLQHFGELRYYALKSGKEIDLILNKTIAFEIKETPTEYDLKKLCILSSKLGLSNSRLIGRYQVNGFKNYIWAGEIR